MEADPAAERPMMYATAPDGARIEAVPRLKACMCPLCGSPVVAKCGLIVIWHWAHAVGGECDSWAEPMSAWHRAWQEGVPPERREVVMGPHRADVVTASGVIAELLHSAISPSVSPEREEFYGARMAWIVDATRWSEADRIGVEVVRQYRQTASPPSGE